MMQSFADEAELSTPMFFSFSYVRKQTKHQRQNSLISSSWRLGFLGGGRALFIISWKAPDLCHFPIQNLSFAKKSVLNSQSAVSASTGLSAERRTPLYFLTSSRSFSVSFLGPVHLLLQSLRLNESLKQSMGERLLKSVDIHLSSSLRTRAVSRAFLNQCKGAWKRGRSYVYLLICWLVNHLVCYVITTRENCNPWLQLSVDWSSALSTIIRKKIQESDGSNQRD